MGVINMKTISFFGHRRIFQSDIVGQKIIKVLQEIALKEQVNLLIGTHGDFDNLVLLKCLEFRKRFNNDVKITVVLTSLSPLNKNKFGYSGADFYIKENCQTMIYEIEEVYFKNKITITNKKMVDNSDLVVCYVDFNKQLSGAKKAVIYALKQDKKVINLFS